jgi:hypothetical protein
MRGKFQHTHLCCSQQNAHGPLRPDQVSTVVDTFAAATSTPRPEPPDADPHVRWCGSREAQTPRRPV